MQQGEDIDPDEAITCYLEQKRGEKQRIWSKFYFSVLRIPAESLTFLKNKFARRRDSGSSISPEPLDLKDESAATLNLNRSLSSITEGADLDTTSTLKPIQRKARLKVIKREKFNFLAGAEENFQKCDNKLAQFELFRKIKVFLSVYSAEDVWIKESRGLFVENGQLNIVNKCENSLKSYYKSGSLHFESKKIDPWKRLDDIKSPDYIYKAFSDRDESLYAVFDAFKRFLKSRSASILPPDKEKDFLNLFRNFRKISLRTTRSPTKQFLDLQKHMLNAIKRLKKPSSTCFSQIILFLRLLNLHQNQEGYSHELAAVFVPVFFQHTLAERCYKKKRIDRNLLAELNGILYFLIESQCDLSSNKITYSYRKQDAIITTSVIRKLSFSQLQFLFHAQDSQQFGTRHIYTIPFGLFTGSEVPLNCFFVDCLDFLRGCSTKEIDFFFESEERETLTKYEIFIVKQRIKGRFFELGPLRLLEKLQLDTEDKVFKVAEAVKIYLSMFPKLILQRAYETILFYTYNHLLSGDISEYNAVKCIETFLLDGKSPRRRATLGMLLDFLLKLVNLAEDKTEFMEDLAIALVDSFMEYPEGDQENARKMFVFLIRVYNSIKWKSLNQSENPGKNVDHLEMFEDRTFYLFGIGI